MTELQQATDDWVVVLREERARYQDLFEFAPVAYLLTDAASKILEANRTAGKLLGIDPSRLVGKPFTAFVPVENRRRFRRTLLGLAHTTTEAEWELDLVGREGARVHVQVNATRSLEGRLRWTIQDITERVSTEHRLRTLASALEERVLERTDELEQERARLTAIVEQLPEGVVVMDASSSRVLMVNEQARQILGPAQEGAPLGDDAQPLLRALERQTVVRERVQLVKPSGERRVLSVDAAPVHDRAGRITAAVSIVQDVTEQEAHERAEREFVTNAAHELQSPIAAITSAVEVLQAGAKDTADRELFIDYIGQASHRLARLTTALLTLSRAQTEVEAPRMEVIELAPMLESIAGRMEPAKGVSLTVECPTDLALLANRELLEQLVSNVLRNAVKYTDAGSIRLEAAPRDGRVEVRVVDTGIGISADVLPRVTKRFFRGEGSSREGFGLGLSIVAAALEVMDGELEVASKGIGHGTTVMISLPLGATLR